MSNDILAQACLLAPLITFFIAIVFFRRKHNIAAAVAIAGGAVSLITSMWLLFKGVDGVEVYQWDWFDMAGVQLQFGVMLDGRSLLMGAVVGLITFCIKVYSLGYMADDPGKGRFFAFLSFFEWSMLSFAYAPNLLQTFIFWELVGLASFLLIGFWYHKPSAVAASKKAFIMTRIGDVGMFVGLILITSYFDSNPLTPGVDPTLDILTIQQAFANGLPAGMTQNQVELIAGLLFLGVMGKSAQFPLHTWLPDAMEGPTPVSALLHSATMVAAGVFLFARFHELFMVATTVCTIVLGIAAFTAFMSSTMAMVANDMKRVLAYSSISQLGFMLLALAGGSLFAGLFHLTTHALFKALLFLVAGAYIHKSGTNDMVSIGRDGGRKLTVVTLGLVAGGSALAGLPYIVSGFYSKESIFASLEGPGETVFLIGAITAAFLTAYYTFRMVFFVLRPNAESQAFVEEPAGAQWVEEVEVEEEVQVQAKDHDHDHGHGHAPGWAMKAPILLLTVGAIGAGFFSTWFADLLGMPHDQIPHPSGAVMGAGIGVVTLGLVLAWLEYGKDGAKQTGFVSGSKALWSFLRKGWRFDELYAKTVVALSLLIARIAYFFETKGIDDNADRAAKVAVDLAGDVSLSHTGMLQLYIGVAVVVLGTVCLAIGLS